MFSVFSYAQRFTSSLVSTCWRQLESSHQFLPFVQINLISPKKIKTSKVIKLQLRHIIESTDNTKRLRRNCPEVTSDFLLALLNEFPSVSLLALVCDAVEDQSASNLFLKFSLLWASITLSPGWYSSSSRCSGSLTVKLSICPSIHSSIYPSMQPSTPCSITQCTRYGENQPGIFMPGLTV